MSSYQRLPGSSNRRRPSGAWSFTRFNCSWPGDGFVNPRHDYEYASQAAGAWGVWCHFTCGCRIGCPRPLRWWSRPSGRTDTEGRPRCQQPGGSRALMMAAPPLLRCQSPPPGCTELETHIHRFTPLSCDFLLHTLHFITFLSMQSNKQVI